MKRTTVKISDELDAKLRHEAARRGVTIAEVIREAVDLYLNGTSRRRLGFVALGNSGVDDVAERVEEILREEWGRAASS